MMIQTQLINNSFGCKNELLMAGNDTFILCQPNEDVLNLLEYLTMLIWNRCILVLYLSILVFGVLLSNNVMVGLTQEL